MRTIEIVKKRYEDVEVGDVVQNASDGGWYRVQELRVEGEEVTLRYRGVWHCAYGPLFLIPVQVVHE